TPTTNNSRSNPHCSPYRTPATREPHTQTSGPVPTIVWVPGLMLHEPPQAARSPDVCRPCDTTDPDHARHHDWYDSPDHANQPRPRTPTPGCRSAAPHAEPATPSGPPPAPSPPAWPTAPHRRGRHHCR